VTLEATLCYLTIVCPHNCVVSRGPDLAKGPGLALFLGHNTTAGGGSMADVRDDNGGDGGPERPQAPDRGSLPTYLDDLDSSAAVYHESQTSEVAARRGGILLDYFRVRLPDDRETWQGLERWLGSRGGWVARGRGWRSYYDDSYSVLEGGVVACCHDRARAEVEGLLVDLPGKAVACLGSDLDGFVAWSLERGKVTRADFAIDDRDGRITLDRIREVEASGGLVTRWRSGMRVIERVNVGKVEGWTVYLGARTSEAYVRIYNKKGEQQEKGRDMSGVDSWVRLELEAKGKLADALCRAVAEQGGAAVVGQINRRMRFVVPSPTDSNRWRAEAAPWWQSFIGSVQAGPSLLCGERPDTTIDRLAVWAETVAGPALATLLEADGGDPARLLAMVDRAKGRAMGKPKYVAALSRWQAEGGGGGQ